METLAIVAASLSMLAIVLMQSVYATRHDRQRARIRVRRELAKRSYREGIIHEWGERRIKEH